MEKNKKKYVPEGLFFLVNVINSLCPESPTGMES